MPKFRKKPVVIEAVCWDGSANSTIEIAEWMEVETIRERPAKNVLVIPTLEGEKEASPGDWIIKGIKGDFYPCKPDNFEAIYEPAGGEDAPTG